MLLETGERPLWVRWLVRAGRLWNRLLAEPQGSLLQRALTASLQLAARGPADLPPGWRPWAAQLAVALAAVGMPVDLQSPRPLCMAQLRRAAPGRHLQEISAAAAHLGASKLAQYLTTGCDSLGGSAAAGRRGRRPRPGRVPRRSALLYTL